MNLYTGPRWLRIGVPLGRHYRRRVVPQPRWRRGRPRASRRFWWLVVAAVLVGRVPVVPEMLLVAAVLVYLHDRRRARRWVVEPPRQLTPAERWAIYRRDQYRCRYCGTDVDLTIDHVLPRSRGGSNAPSNLVTACRSCNSAKGARIWPQPPPPKKR